MSKANITPTPRLAHAFRLAIQFGAQLNVGLLATGGARCHAPISGGRIDGEQLHGAVVGGHGGQLLLCRSDRVCVATLSCVVRTDDDCLLWLSGQGYRTGETRGETSLTLAFEADEQGPYAWLARVAFVARNDASRLAVFDVAAVL